MHNVTSTPAAHCAYVLHPPPLSAAVPVHMLRSAQCLVEASAPRKWMSGNEYPWVGGVEVPPAYLTRPSLLLRKAITASGRAGRVGDDLDDGLEPGGRAARFRIDVAG